MGQEGPATCGDEAGPAPPDTPARGKTVTARRADRPVPPIEEDLKRRVAEGVAHLIGEQRLDHG